MGTLVVLLDNDKLFDLLGFRQKRDALYFRGLSGIMFVGVPASQ